MLLRGELQKYAKNSNFENFQSALYTTSVSMPLIAIVPPDITFFVGWNARNKVGVRDGGGAKRKRSTEIYE